MSNIRRFFSIQISIKNRRIYEQMLRWRLDVSRLHLCASSVWPHSISVAYKIKEPYEKKVKEVAKSKWLLMALSDLLIFYIGKPCLHE